MWSSKNSYYYFTVHPHTSLGNKPIHKSKINQFSIWSIQCIIVIPSDEKLVNHTSVQCTDLVHCVSESEIGFWKAKSPCANGERGIPGVTRLAGRTGLGWPSSGWAGQESGEVNGAARACVICVHAYLFPGGFFVNKPEIAFAALRYSPRQYTVFRAVGRSENPGVPVVIRWA